MCKDFTVNIWIVLFSAFILCKILNITNNNIIKKLFINILQSKKNEFKISFNFGDFLFASYKFM